MTEFRIERTVRKILNEDDDLFGGIVRVAAEHNITNARVTGNGTVQSAVLSSHDQKLMAHSEITIEGPMEIVSMYGTITRTDGILHPDVHLVLSDPEGNGNGGRLVPDSTPVLFCEVILEQFSERTPSIELIRSGRSDRNIQQHLSQHQAE